MFRLKLFGGATLEAEQQGAPIASRRRSLAFLALLAGAGERGLSRDKLAAFLWSESDVERARHALAQTLYAIRRELSTDVVLAVGNDLRLRADLIAVDLWDFEAALARGDREGPVAIYRGPFLDGFYIADAPEFERWVDAERARLARCFTDALRELSHQAGVRGDQRAAADWLRRAVSADPFDSPLALRYMKALAASGDPSAAIRHGRVHETLIRDELKITHDPDVRAYTQQLRNELRSAALTTSSETTPSSYSSKSGSTFPGANVIDAPTRDIARETTGTLSPVLEDSSRRSSPSRLLAADHQSQTAATLSPQGGAPNVTSNGPSAAAAAVIAKPGVAAANIIPSRLRYSRVVVAVMSVALLLIVALARRQDRPVPRAESPVLAVGSVREFGGTDTSGILRVLAEMLATNMARVPSLHVVSNTRIYELLGSTAGEGDESARLAVAAERAGASQLVQGLLYRRPGAEMRLDVQRIDVATGRVQGAYSVQARDLFALVDSATARLAADLRVPAGSLRVADVTTTSLVALRFYDEGLRAYFQIGDARSALRLFQRALEEDSSFAMASYYASHASLAIGDASQLQEARAALRLSAGASERERLLINADLRDLYSDPLGKAYAESLVARYPNETNSHLIMGNVLVHDGEFVAALPHLRRVIEMDSFSISRQAALCRACEAYSLVSSAYWQADSVEQAERVARELATRRPRMPGPLVTLATILEQLNRNEQAAYYWGRVAELQGGIITPLTHARLQIRAGRFSEADALLRAESADKSSPLGARLEALWFTIISKRYQGQMGAARDAVEQILKLTPNDYAASQALGQVLFETGRYQESARLFFSLAWRPDYPGMPSRKARDVSWNLVHVANAVGAMGDTIRLKKLTDSLQLIGSQSSYGRDGRLHHYARGLLARARGDESGAAEEFRRAIFSPNMGYTRANFELAHSLLALHRPAEAVPVLRAALRGSLEASNFYLSHTELHERLARAFDGIGQLDSARVHYEWVAAAWQHADPQFGERVAYARQRIAAIRAGRVSRADDASEARLPTRLE